jgi:hypothetical protein
MTEPHIPRAAPEPPPPAPDNDNATLALLRRLAREDRSGGSVVERAAILAEGADSTRVVAWIMAHGGQPEAAVVTVKRGLHSARHDEAAAASRPPLRYVLPAGALSTLGE